MKKLSLLGVTALSILVLAACGNQNSTAESSTESDLQSTVDSLKKENAELKTSNSNLTETINSYRNEESAEFEETESQVFGLNEEGIIADESGNPLYSLKIISATTAVDADSPATGENLVQVTYEYKNYALSNPLIVSNQFIIAYDSNGNAGDGSGYMDGQNEVSEGKASQSTIWFNMPTDPSTMDKIEIDYSNDFSIGFEGTMQFEILLTH